MKYLYLITVLCSALLAKSQAEGAEIDSLKRIYNSSQADTLRLDALNTLVWPVYSGSHPDSGIKYGLVAIDLANRLKDQRRLMVTYRRLGICYTNIGNYKAGLNYYELSLDLAMQLKDTKSMGIAYGNIGALYLNVGDYTKALGYNYKSIRLKEQAKDYGSIYANYYNLGLIHKNIGEYDKALANMDSSAKYAERLKDDRSLAITYNGIGMVYKGKHQPGKSKEYYRLAMLYNKKSDNEYNMTETYNDLGSLFCEEKQYDSAYYYFEQALELSRRLHNIKSLQLSLSNLAVVNLAKKKYQESIRYANESLSHGTEDLANAEFCYGVLSDAYRALKNYEQALVYTDKRKVIRDSIGNINKNKDLVRLQLQYDYDKKLSADSIRFSDQQKISTAKIEAADAKLNQEKTFRYALLLGLLGLLVFSYLIYSRLKLIRSQKNTIEQQKNEMEYQKDLVEHKQKEIVDSINYARRIQYTLLAQDELIKKHLPEFFILFKPKDIVSGDFYWAAEKHDRFYLAVCDCTGHGVPGAFMSLLNISFLNEAVNQHNISEPNDILRHVRKRLIESISQEGGQDGMDAVLLCFHLSNGRISYAAANNKPVIVRDGRFMTLPADKMPVGKGERDLPFTLFSIEAQKGDRLYMYSDGYADQFGGPKGKKFKYKQLEELLTANAQLPMQEQARTLEQDFEQWKSGHEQVDDVLVAGLTIQ